MILHRVLPLTMLLALASGYNYCNNKTHVCNLGGLKHFMCRLDEELPAYKETTFVDLVPDTRILQSELTVLLNNFRDMLASGQAITNLNKTFPSATRMRRLIWDNELAYLSRVHASTVSFKHTECRSTLRFPFVGEITAMLAAPPEKKLTMHHVIRRAFRRIWTAHRHVEDPKKFIEAFTPTSNISAADFAIIINDRVSRVGCGIAVGSKDSSSFSYFLTCYFDNTNIVNAPIYRPGVPTSGCDEWQTVPSTKWSYLCKNLGLIFPNVSGRVLGLTPIYCSTPQD